MRRGLTLPPPTRKGKVCRPIPYDFWVPRGSGKSFVPFRVYKERQPRRVGGEAAEGAVYQRKDDQKHKQNRGAIGQRT
ncbi:hypothetical protein NDU88_003415 [Pleurodeles waltl]|uniref:Uncharacterized protein n=1 Tax=Pleurodeles waltl TaxID=8319 RepID=A0AAV7M6V3_PLEWA|nr:hypothetical protein NDU88_003415 [Pleurodeles waltl]